MINLSAGWAIADVSPQQARRLLRTTDGGETWRDVSPLEAEFYGWFVLNAHTAWAWPTGSDPAWRTTDGGQTWEKLGAFGSNPDLGFSDSQHGWKLNGEPWGLTFRQFDIVSFSTTRDGGSSWQEVSHPGGFGNAYMTYPERQTAWALRAGFSKAGYGTPNLAIPIRVSTTFDGGQTWITRQLPLPEETSRVDRGWEGIYLGGVGHCEFVSPVYGSAAIWKLALTCEEGSWLYTTANQGKTWIISAMPAGVLPEVYFVNPTVGWLFVAEPGPEGEGRLYRTASGGTSWQLITTTGWHDLEMSFVSPRSGWAVAVGSCTEAPCSRPERPTALVKTVDGGESWQALNPLLTP